MAREIRCFDYVNHPYERVREALSGDARAVFQAATRAASSRAESVAAALKVNIGSLEVATEIAISIGDVEQSPAQALSPPRTRIELEWEAARGLHDMCEDTWRWQSQNPQGYADAS